MLVLQNFYAVHFKAGALQDNKNDYCREWENPNTTWSSALRMFSECITVYIFYPKKSSWTLLTYSLFCGVITDASSEITVMFRSWRRSGSTSLLTQTSSQHQHKYENPWGNQHRTWYDHLEQGSSASSQWLCRVAELDVNHNNHTQFSIHLFLTMRTIFINWYFKNNSNHLVKEQSPSCPPMQRSHLQVLCAADPGKQLCRNSCNSEDCTANKCDLTEQRNRYQDYAKSLHTSSQMLPKPKLCYLSTLKAFNYFYI